MLLLYFLFNYYSQNTHIVCLGHTKFVRYQEGPNQQHSKKTKQNLKIWFKKTWKRNILTNAHILQIS